MKRSISTLMLLLIITSCSTKQAQRNIASEEDRTKNKIEKLYEKYEVRSRISKEIANLDIKANLKLLNLSDYQGANLSSGYRYEVTPSFEGNLHTRVDTWNITANLIPTQFLPKYNLPIGMNINAGAQLIFIRHFKSKLEATKALPYTPAKIPFTAEKAIKELNPGDFLKFPANLSFAVSGSLLAKSFGVANLTSSASYVVSGQFQVHLYKIKDKKVRIKLIAIRGKSKSLGAAVSFGFSIFQPKYVEKYVGNRVKNQFIGMNPLSTSVYKNKNEVMMVDYIYDLNYKESREAYNDLVKANLKFKFPVLLNPAMNKEKLRSRFLSDLDSTEKIYQEDKDLPKSKQRVARPFRGDVTAYTTGMDFKIGLQAISFSNSNNYTKNNISFRNKNGKLENYFFPDQTHITHKKFLFGLFEENSITHNYALFETDKDYKIKNFKTFGMSFDIRDKDFRNAERKKQMKYLKATLPNVIYKSIDWSTWLRKGVKANARLKVDIAFKEHSLDIFENMKKETIKEKFKEYVKKKGFKLSEYDLYFTPIKMARRLGDIFDLNAIDTDYNLKFSKFTDLLKQQYFKKFGLGFLIYLLEDDAKDNVYLSLSWVADDMKPITVEFGSNNENDLYKNIKYIHNVLNNQSFDRTLLQD